jgi:hypothetical protein
MVMFRNNTSEYGIQTQDMSRDLRAWNGDDTMSYVYLLKSKDTDAPIAYLRLCPNGMFTTAKHDATTLYGVKTYLQFYAAMSITTPLPPLPPSMRRAARIFKHAQTKYARNKTAYEDYVIDKLSDTHI